MTLMLCDVLIPFFVLMLQAINAKKDYQKFAKETPATWLMRKRNMRHMCTSELHLHHNVTKRGRAFGEN